MGELRLHALSITEIRDMVGASPELARTLRTIAGERFRVTDRHQQRGLLGKLGPLLKRSAANSPVFPPTMPLPSDWENLIAGRYIAPERLELSWLVLDTWIDALDWGTLTWQFSPAELDDFDFALTRAGLPARHGLRKMMGADAQLGVRPGPDMRVGYAKNAHVLAGGEELARVVDQVEDHHRAAATGLRDFLAEFPAWTRTAIDQGRPAPDLFVVWWERARP